MKLCQLRIASDTIPAIQDGDQHRDARSLAAAFDADFFAGDGASRLRAVDASSLPVIDRFDSFGPCVSKPSKVVCVGLNYHEHARESGMDAPSEPVIFFKSPSALSGPNDDIRLPPDADMVDWEVELALVIGSRAKHVSKADALSHVAGFMILNDVSDRHAQLHRGGQWAKGKSYDSFAPIGPYLDLHIEDPHALNLVLSVNGTRMQNGNTADYIFDIPTVIEHLSEFMTLEPGDIITTGTPSGVGIGMNPKQFLKPGDTIETTITGLGAQRQTVVRDH